MTKERKRNSVSGKLLRMLKWLLPLALVAGLLALAYGPKAVEVDIGLVEDGPMLLTVDDDGESRIRERYMISAPLAGRLLRVTLDPGDEVKEGDVLATLVPGAPELLDPRARARAEAMVSAAEASVASAGTQGEAREIEAGQLEKAFLRNKTLHEKGNVADAALEVAESAWLAAKHAASAARSTVEIARFDLEQAKAALLRFDGGEGTSNADPGDWHFVIRSPITGRVLRVHEENSRMLQPGASVLEIGDPTALEMRIDVLSQDAVNIRPGQKVIVEHWGGGKALDGRVRRVGPSAYTKVSALGVDEQRVDVIADFDALPEEGETLGDGYRVEARIVIWESADVLQVPVGALFRDRGQWAVFRIDGDHARKRVIAIGRNNGEVAEVLSGLSAGDRVVLHPGDRIGEDTLLAPRS